MNSLVPKNLAALCILEILHKYSGSRPPLTQQRIIDLLERDYGISMERNAVKRNIDSLTDAGFDIYSERAEGSNSIIYSMEREFDDSELHLLIDSVLSSSHISAGHSRQLIEKLCSLSNENFRSHVKNVYSVSQWNKTENKQLFYNIAVVDEAIENGCMVKFTYNRYGADKKLHKTCDHTVSPYQFILHNQRYYLMGCNEKWGNIGYYRADRITNIQLLTEASATPLRAVEGYENGIDYRRISTAMPYMFTDKPAGVQFYAERDILDQVVDWFGDNAVIKEEGGRLRVHVNVSLMAMEYWVLQYAKSVEVIAPAEFREKIIADLKFALDKYGK